MKKRFFVPFLFFLLIFPLICVAGKPDIGLLYTTDQFEKLEKGVADPLHLYTSAIEENGGNRVVLGQQEGPALQEEKLASLEGLIIPGGADVAPCYYGEAPHEKLEETDGELDQFEFRVLAFALEHKLPVLGICRGHQLMNVYFGGSLYQDIPAQVGVDTVHRKGNPPMHPVTITGGSLMHRILGAENAEVNSYHHQAVKEPAPGFSITARTPDGIVEAMEGTGDVFMMGVQFHPEKLRAEMPRFNIFFTRLVEAAREIAIRENSLYDIQLDTVCSGFDGETCWVHPRAGTIPGETPIVVMTMQKLLLSGSDIFYALNEMRTDDLGKTWTGPVEHESLGRRQEPEFVAVICDFTPKWHAASGKLLGTGHVARYQNNHLAKSYPRQTAYSWYDPEKRAWAEWRTVEMPEDPKFYSSGAGSTQRVDLPDGDILLPIYFKAKGVKTASTTVMRCRFDGETLRYIDHGDELAIDVPRGLGEPSLIPFHGRYYLTLRNDVKGYVTSGTDGLHFDKPRPWTFDDGAELGNYNTQQHWVSHGDALFLVYTRRDPEYDHIFRHRAPLRMARVDPERLCVIRDTERILIPARGARLGNFAVTEVNENETWVTVAEWMQPVGCEKYGSDNAVYAARILWRD